MIHELEDKTKLPKVMIFFGRLFWTSVILFWVVLILGPTSAVCYFYLNPCDCAIQYYFFDAVERGDKDDIFKYAKAYEKREKKKARKPSWADTKAFAYMYFYMIAYEFSGDYDKALEYDFKFSEMKKAYRPMNSDICSISSPYDRARILYKKGMKKEAFIEYCSIESIEDDYASLCESLINSGKLFTPDEYCEKIILFKKRKQSLITLREIKDREWLPKLSCFIDYDEFLNFLTSEFEKLGCPMEYATPVGEYRLLSLEQGWNRKPPECVQLDFEN